MTFNPGSSLERTFASVREQTWRPRFEYLVIDGGSTDGTVEMLRRAEESQLVNDWVSEPDKGIYDAMNKAVARGSGEYILFLNAGDTFASPNSLKDLFERDSDRSDFYWGDCEIVRGSSHTLDRADRMLRFLYRQMSVSHQSLAIRTDFLRHHPFDIDLKVAADYEVLCALITSGARGQYQRVVVSRIEEEGFSSRHFFVGLSEKRTISRRYFPSEQWRAGPYFVLWGLYMRIKMWYKERS